MTHDSPHADTDSPHEDDEVVESDVLDANLAKKVDEKNAKHFFSSVDDQTQFNHWYEKQIHKSKPRKRNVKKPIYESCSSPNQILQNFSTTKASEENCDNPLPSFPELVPSSQSEVNKEPVWLVNMNTVIVMFFTILSFLYKSSTHRVPNLSTESY